MNDRDFYFQCLLIAERRIQEDPTKKGDRYTATQNIDDILVLARKIYTEYNSLSTPMPKNSCVVE